MNAKAAIMGSFLGAVAIITYRDVKNPDSSWPLPAPPPYRYAGAGIAFGLLALVGEFMNEKLAATLSIGLLVGLGFQTAQTGFPGNFGAGKNGQKFVPGTPSGPNGEILGTVPLNQGGEASRPIT